jgi:hypothetical protein
MVEFFFLHKVANCNRDFPCKSFKTFISGFSRLDGFLLYDKKMALSFFKKHLIAIEPFNQNWL